MQNEREITLNRPQAAARETLNAQAPSVEDVLTDFAASDWLKLALRTALDRDPVDAANDAEVLARLLDARCYQP